MCRVVGVVVMVDKVEVEDEKPRAEKQSREEISSSCLFVIFHSF